MKTEGTADELKPEKVRKLKKITATVEKSTTPFEKMKIVVLMRNAERCDRVFPEYLTVNVNDAGQYEPNDLNLPFFLFERPDGPTGYVNDSPITHLGMATSRMVGHSLKICPLWPLHRIYCSPALRSVQTATEVAKGIKMPVEICIEPALYDFLGWYKSMPSLLSIPDFQRFGFAIYAEYNTLMSVQGLKPLVGKESIQGFYLRVNSAITSIVKKEHSEHIVIITHAPVVDASIKSLRACTPTLITELEMLHMGTFYPYCSTVALAKPDKWSFVFDPIPPLTYLGTSNRVDANFINKTTDPQPPPGTVEAKERK